jgi:hypothetical protein
MKGEYGSWYWYLALFDKINLIYETINNIKVKVVNA